ncbi:tetratricopeptide repeat protein [Roseibium aggregatum]|uniref:Cellulose synthase subunit BcsC n=1 Tax=Roseibium aggregatum TaxID=187304 RepID=A0A0M6XWN5_9HYPH|nr:tetratricopeptide repeat protein [Roseibium aggregatum]MCR9282051.1 tetratricopeptide repeat protein [Paracoccaceae bacterium]MEC9468474.1 tetratricopeptide repeat protein [Pseudomonadota bacterium]CTQ42261.1 cellulose synthase subunit BcsC [Roseibium aggregatum]
MTAAARKAFEEAVALENAGNLDRALVSYLKAQELSPDDTEIAYRTASALLQTGYLDEAQSQLRRIVFAEPDHLNARASLGNCQLLLGDMANARQNFADVLAQAPDNRNALYGLASVLLKEDKPEEASVPARRLVELLPDTPAVLSLFADTQARVDQKAAAIAAYRKALKADPDYGPALIGLSQTLLLRKRFDEVIELTIRASERAPADPLPLDLLSDALAGKGALEDAREAALAALKLSPRSIQTHVRLSSIARKFGDHGAALKHALAAHDLDKSAKEPLNALGAALAALKYSNQARSVLTAMSRGDGLEPAIRELVEGLVVAERKSPEAGPASSPATSATEAPSSDNPDDAAKIAQEKETKQVIQHQESLEPVTSKKILATDGDQLPNVLGLRRQDRS